MNKILIPSDFSTDSDNALEYASFITKEKGGKLYILHIWRSRSEEDLNKEIERIKACKYLDGVPFEIIIEKGGSISKTINKVAIRLKVDLIVMGSNGISNVGEMLLGSNTENVIRNSKFNVLTIKHQMLSLGLKNILFPSNFSPESYAVFGEIKNFANLFGSKIHLLSVMSSSSTKKKKVVEEKMECFIKHFNLKPEEYQKAIYTDKKQALGVMNYAIDNDIDLIAIGSHGKNIIQKKIKESISQNLVRDAFRPVLTVRF